MTRVSHWEHYIGEREPCPHTHSIDVIDELATHGTVRVIAGALGEKSTDNWPDVKVDISSYQGREEKLPTFHLSFNANSHACSIYRRPDGTFLLCLEHGVDLIPSETTGEFILKEMPNEV